MNIAIVVDDAFRLEKASKDFLKDVFEYSIDADTIAYEGKFKNISVSLIFFKCHKRYLSLKIQNLISKPVKAIVFDDFGDKDKEKVMEKNFDLIINVGYCGVSNNFHLYPGDLVLVSNAYTKDSIGLEQKSINLDPNLIADVLSCARKRDIPVVPTSCYSVFCHEDMDSLHPCVDLKSYYIYSMAEKMNKKILCLYAPMEMNVFDINGYFFEKRTKELDLLIELSLYLGLELSSRN